jgi:anti-sigma B factor antagonist
VGAATSDPTGRGPNMSRQRITVEDVGDVAVVQFVDKKILDEQNIQMIGDDLFRLVDELGRRKLLLNFTNVDFMSSAALGKLIRLHQRLTQVGGKLILCGISKDIMQVFTLTKLDKMLKIVKDEQTGLGSF